MSKLKATGTVIEGKVERVLWENQDDGFTIFLLTTKKGRTAAKGTIPTGSLVEGLPVRLRGKFESTKRHGRTFVFKRFALGQDPSSAGLMKVLEYGVKGIGPVTAKALVDAYGTDLTKVLSEDPDRLLELEMFRTPSGREKHAQLVKRWASFRGNVRTSSFLLGHGLGPAMSKRAYDRFGDNTVDAVRNDPYVLLDVPGIGFKLADQVAFSLGVPADDERRVRAAVSYVLERSASQEGHLYLEWSDLYLRVCKVTDLGIRNFGRILSEEEVSERRDEMASSDFRPRSCQLVVDGTRVYLRSYFLDEQSSAEKLASTLASPASVELEFDPDDIQAFGSVELSDRQLDGALRFVGSKIMLLTGLPGTGKTTLLKTLVEILEKSTVTTTLMAPTGIAAKRISQVTQRPASTIHRCLQFNGFSWGRNADHPLESDVVIVDESSMIDQSLFYRLLDAVPSDSRLLLVGDPAQLPSVGPGNVLRELISSECVPHVHLTEIFRQDEASDIVTNAHRITNGEMPDLEDGVGRDFKFVGCSSSGQVLDRVVKMCLRLQAKHVDFHVMSPMHKGDLGVDNLNVVLKQHLNPPDGRKVEMEINKHLSVRVGDKVMVTVNDYNLGVFNGDMSVVDEVVPKGKRRGVSFYVDQVDALGSTRTELVHMSVAEASRLLKLAFATTVHKMQGLEADVILLPFTKQFSIMLQRNLFYTAVTRARSKVIVVGEWSAVRRAVLNTRVRKRNTCLADRLRFEVSNYGSDVP